VLCRSKVNTDVVLCVKLLIDSVVILSCIIIILDARHSCWEPSWLWRCIPHKLLEVFLVSRPYHILVVVLILTLHALAVRTELDTEIVLIPVLTNGMYLGRVLNQIVPGPQDSFLPEQLKDLILKLRTPIHSDHILEYLNEPVLPGDLIELPSNLALSKGSLLHCSESLLMQ
jgi:hypothetical protein